ncbi:adenylate kinase 7 isoform X2 [Aethina tumida]|uniref:adenylate kinase 7 isoform X2 n=1 Tax=Aethina tumida TaxID=116153 RepID=UPI002147A57A|nr:adenylate kinase 7 isoform X2 [Aethina tumida]
MSENEESSGLEDVEFDPVSPETFSSSAEVIQHRIFYSHADSYIGRNMTSFFHDQEYKANGGGAAGEGEGVQNLDTVKYEIVGTYKSELSCLDNVVATISTNDQNKFKDSLLKCGVVIFDISHDDTQIENALNALKLIEEDIESSVTGGPEQNTGKLGARIFILISTIMTWGNTESDTKFLHEDHLEKRKPHIQFERHFECENEILKARHKFPGLLDTYVVCAGMTYGVGEDDMLPFFKLAWHSEPVPCLLPGDNHVPFIHVNDLAGIIFKVICMNPSQSPYIFGVEVDIKNLRVCDILTSLSVTMGSGRIKYVTCSEAMLYSGMTLHIMERCMINLRVYPTVADNLLDISWRHSIDNIENVASEFMEQRRLITKKIVLHGPPGTGKTVLAKMIQAKYGLHYINVGSMINSIMENLRNKINEAITNGYDTDWYEEMFKDENVTVWKKQLRTIALQMEGPTRKLPDEMVNRLLRNYLMGNSCQHIGYILDGYPKTYQQALNLFGHSTDPHREYIRTKIMPFDVISLHASDEYIKKKIRETPEDVIVDKQYTEDDITRKLATYKLDNSEETALNLFDEIGLNPVILHVENPELSHTNLMEIAEHILGLPSTFDVTPEKVIEQYRYDRDS